MHQDTGQDGRFLRRKTEQDYPAPMLFHADQGLGQGIIREGGDCKQGGAIGQARRLCRSESGRNYR